jgi:hypothetical protein
LSAWTQSKQVTENESNAWIGGSKLLDGIIDFAVLCLEAVDGGIVAACNCAIQQGSRKFRTTGHGHGPVPLTRQEGKPT